MRILIASLGLAAPEVPVRRRDTTVLVPGTAMVRSPVPPVKELPGCPHLT